MRYEAFISYSHRDKAWARWLQGALERYRLPKAVRDGPGRDGGKRLRPFFRDDTELASSEDLTASITRAMEESAALIVICSPQAAASLWTDREIRAFRKIAPGRPILPILVEGRPERDATDCAFPEAMLFDESGAPRPEPLAADVRANADGKRGAVLKLIAGLLGVGVDDLRQRDQQRRLRVMGAVTTGALAISVVTIALAVFAIQARNEAEVRRDQAESLIDFMLVDLRERLQPIGRLDVLDAVGEEAGEYFNALGTLGTDDEVLKRALALRQLGEVEFARRDLPAALAAFEDSRELTATLLARAPGNLEYLFEQSQAEFWVGYVAWEGNDLSGAEASFLRYHDLSKQLLDTDPDNADYQLEMVYALTNLGALARAQGDSSAALAYIQSANQLNETLLAASPDDDALKVELAQGYSWEGSALLDEGRLKASDDALSRSVSLMGSAWESREDKRMGEQFGYVLGIHANLKWHLGDVPAAQALLVDCERTFGELAAHDPGNESWVQAHQRCRFWLAEVHMHQALHAQAFAFVEAGLAILDELAPGNQGNSRLLDDRALGMCLRARLAFTTGDMAAAHRDALDCVRLRKEISGHGGTGDAFLQLALAQELVGQILYAMGDQEGAEASWSEAATRLLSYDSAKPASRAARMLLAYRVGQFDIAMEEREALAQMGFSDPRYQPTFEALDSTEF